MSCDSYEDLWGPFFALFKRHWPDCPFPVYLGSGQLESGQLSVTTLHSDGGRDWSKCALDYLQRLSTPYVLLMLDDFFFRKPVPTGEVQHCLDFARTNDAVQVRLIPRPKPTERLAGESLIGESIVGSPYRLSMQAAIWNRSKLIELLRAGESIWEFEHNVNKRALEYRNGFYSVWKSVLPYQGFFAHHVVEKGKWLPHEKWIFGRQKIGCKFACRGVLPWPRLFLYQVVQLFDAALNLIPWRMKMRIKNALKFMLDPLIGQQFRRMGGLELVSAEKRKKSPVD